MTLQSRIGLRELVRLLQHTDRCRGSASKARRELLNLLKDGKISAFFHFPSAENPMIVITAAFWHSVSIGKFRQRLGPNSTGGFLVDPEKFVEPYVSWFTSNVLTHDSDPAKISLELTRALSDWGERREVYVDEAEWDAFVTSAQLVAFEPGRRSSRGRKPEHIWPDILVNLAAVMLIDETSGLQSTQTKLAAKALTSALGKLGIIATPTVETVALKVSEIRTLRDKLVSEAKSSSDQKGTPGRPSGG